MLKFKNIFLATTMTALLSSCGNEFMELEPHQQIGDAIAIHKIEDIKTALSGAYYWMGHYGFNGRNLTAIGDVATDNVYSTESTSHLSSIYNYTFQPTTGDLKNVWEVGYKVIDHSARIIKSANKLLETAPTKADSATIWQGLSQAYALRGYATFALTNLFSMPYTQANLETPGVVLVEEPVQPFQKVTRASLEDTYAYILEQFENAAVNAARSPEITNKQFYLNAEAIEAMKARVYLYMGDFEKAKQYAQSAIDKRKGAMVTTVDAYNEMFNKLSGSSEDIFTIAKANDDNLSAYSLNTLYVNYGFEISSDLRGLYADTDIRKQKLTGFVLDKEGKEDYYAGGKYAETVTNVPVIRLPEMYLIIAECEAEAGNTAEAAKALLNVAKRNTAITTVAHLPNEANALKAFIAEERRRELFQEGHRLYDARRRGETLTLDSRKLILNKGLFLYPIPAAEINTGMGVTQNQNWLDFLPTEIKR